jgi:lysine-N-methylase
MITPHYYKKFRCIGSECKNNCCCGEWQIEVDEDALDRFANIQGEFGDKVRNSINSENVFVRQNGR